MEREILELINNCDKVDSKRKGRKLKILYEELKEENSRIIEANIKLVDKNKYLLEDIKILSEFINTYFNENELIRPDVLNEDVKRIVNNYKEKENEKRI